MFHAACINGLRKQRNSIAFPGSRFNAGFLKDAEGGRKHSLRAIRAGTPNKLWHPGDQLSILMPEQVPFRRTKTVKLLIRLGDSQQWFENISQKSSPLQLSKRCW